MSSISNIGQSLLQFAQQLTGSSQASSDTSPTATAQSTTTGPAQATHHHHHRGGAFAKIASAVTSALQSAQNSGDASDPDSVIKSAIEQVLGGPSAASGSGAQGTAATTDPNSPQAKFLQALQSFGVSPEQFQNDLESAVKDAQGGNPNLNSIFQSFGSGSILDTLG